MNLRALFAMREDVNYCNFMLVGRVVSPLGAGHFPTDEFSNGK